MIENVTISNNNKTTNEFVSLDELYTPRDVGGLDKTTDSNPDGSGDLEMNLEDMKLLGFHVVEADEIAPEQRTSKISITYEEGG